MGRKISIRLIVVCCVLRESVALVVLGVLELRSFSFFSPFFPLDVFFRFFFLFSFPECDGVIDSLLLFLFLWGEG